MLEFLLFLNFFFRFFCSLYLTIGEFSLDRRKRKRSISYIIPFPLLSSPPPFLLLRWNVRFSIIVTKPIVFSLISFRVWGRTNNFCTTKISPQPLNFSVYNTGNIVYTVRQKDLVGKWKLAFSSDELFTETHKYRTLW